MKTKTFQGILMSALLAIPAFADESRIETYRTQLRGVRPPELPSETARLISNSKADVADAVAAALSLNSASAQLIVGSVAKSSPKSAAAAAATAIASEPKLTANLALQPRLTVAIIRAAVSAAPSEVSAIVTESCKARPVSFETIGVAAAEAAPKSSDKVIPAIISGVPVLKPIIQRAEADFKAANRSARLALVLTHAENLLAAIARDLNVSMETLLATETETTIAEKLALKASKAGPAPVQRPPFVGGGTPIEIPTGSTTNLPPTNRVYSAP